LAVALLLVGWAPDYAAPWDEEDIPAVIVDDGKSDDEFVDTNNATNVVKTSSNNNNNNTNDSTNSSSSSSNNNNNNIHNSNSKIENQKSPWNWLLKRMDIKRCVERLSKDDRDVYLNVSQLRVLYPDIDFEMISCRGKKIAPGGNIPIELDGSEVPAADPTLLESALSHERERRRSNSLTSLIDRSSSVEGVLDDTSSAHSGSLIKMATSVNTISAALSCLNEVDEIGKTIRGTNVVQQRRSIDELDAIAAVDNLAAMEHEFLPNVFDAEAIQELDIIDGIVASPSHHSSSNLNANSAVPLALRGRSSIDLGNCNDEDDYDEEEERRAATKKKEDEEKLLQQQLQQSPSNNSNLASHKDLR
jgi:hypothetical protein